MMKRAMAAAITALVLASAPSAWALPITDQTGNLLSNGNFENGTTGWKGTAGILTIATDPLIEGNGTGEIDASGRAGVYNYSTLGVGTYTLSGWFLVESGTARFLLASGSGGNVETEFGSTAGEWVYKELTYTFGAVTISGRTYNKYGIGAKLYTDDDGGSYYAEGIWLNAGTESTNPYSAPTNRIASVPEPGTLLLLGSGLLGLGLIRRKKIF